jgi:hypothetical protein
MSGLTGGRWRRGSPAGHLRVPGRCAEKCHHDGLVGTQPAGHLLPRQRSTLHGRFYKSRLYLPLRRINEYLVRWAMRKYKRLRGHYTNAVRFIQAVAARQPNLFAHWKVGVRSSGWARGAG